MDGLIYHENLGQLTFKKACCNNNGLRASPTVDHLGYAF
jgi:hypothetical protein